MAFNHEQIVRAQWEQITSERARAVAELEDARLREDQYGTMSAASAILDADQKLGALGNIAANLAAQQQQPQGNKYGLTSDEVEIAATIAGNDARISDDERQRVYSLNKERLRYLRATGAYRDDQGVVRR